MKNFNYTLPEVFPSPWAKSWGQDKFGLFMIMEFKGVQQGFRWIRPSSFKMGSTAESDLERNADELQHQVILSQGYWLADTACTQGLWLAVMGKNPSGFQDNPNNPVENVSWDDIQRFIQRLSPEYPGLMVRLPTEAEWEYACRAGTKTPFSFGDNITTDQVNYDGNYPYSGAAKGEFRGKTVAVKTLPLNSWGLYEMHGNVWEWCQDWYDSYEHIEVIDSTRSKERYTRVLRGGSCQTNSKGTRSASRSASRPDSSSGLYGFRLALGEKGMSPAQQKDSRGRARRSGRAISTIR